MRAFLIDPELRTITEIDFAGDYKQIQRTIGCKSFTTGAFSTVRSRQATTWSMSAMTCSPRTTTRNIGFKSTPIAIRRHRFRSPAKGL